MDQYCFDAINRVVETNHFIDLSLFLGGFCAGFLACAILIGHMRRIDRERPA